MKKTPSKILAYILCSACVIGVKPSLARGTASVRCLILRAFNLIIRAFRVDEGMAWGVRIVADDEVECFLNKGRLDCLDGKLNY